jgi:hypothetical protein
LHFESLLFRELSSTSRSNARLFVCHDKHQDSLSRSLCFVVVVFAAAHRVVLAADYNENCSQLSKLIKFLGGQRETHVDLRCNASFFIFGFAVHRFSQMNVAYLKVPGTLVKKMKVFFAVMRLEN